MRNKSRFTWEVADNVGIILWIWPAVVRDVGGDHWVVTWLVGSIGANHLMGVLAVGKVTVWLCAGDGDCAFCCAFGDRSGRGDGDQEWCHDEDKLEAHGDCGC